MNTSPTPQLARAYELLADGEWHDRETIMFEISKVITPGVAVRHAETVRLTSGKAPNPPPVRKVPRSYDFLVATGKRSLARSALRGKRIEHKPDEDGRTLVRLSNPPVKAPPVSPVTYRNITPHLRRAFEMLADGTWHEREHVIAAMVKAVDPDMAFVVAERREAHADQRYGEERRQHRATRAELVERGSRFLAVGALANARRIQRKETEQGVLVRLRPLQYLRPSTTDEENRV